jgi:hypothetical protein
MVLALFLSVESYTSHKLASGATIDVGLHATIITPSTTNLNVDTYLVYTSHP